MPVMTRMKRRWNIRIWAGFAVTLFAALSYFFLFIRFPLTRDIPWATALLFAAGAWFLVVGLTRAFRRPETYRGRISGVVLGTLSIFVIGLFAYFTFALARDLPSASGAPRVGQTAPAFTLPDANGKLVSLHDLLSNHRAALLIFYRGYW